MSETPCPVTRFPNDATARRWEQRIEPAAVTLRCGQGRQSCDRLVLIHETPDGPVVVFYQHTPDRPVALDLPPGGLPDYEPPATFKKFDQETGQALIRGRRDPRGTAVSLEDDAHWGNVIEASCRRHLGSLTFTRAQLMEYLRRAREDRTGRLRVSVPE